MLNRVSATLIVTLALSPSVHAQTFHVLFNFTSTLTGENPYATLLYSGGFLYGTTTGGGGGNSACQGEGERCGTVFQFDPQSGTQSILNAFAGPPADGSSPRSSLIRDTAGNFYGTTSAGGTDNQGTVFRIDAAGTQSVLHNFSGIDGSSPWDGLVRDSGGNLYGVTPGTTVSPYYGTIFQIDPAGNYITLKTVPGLFGVLHWKDGMLYGTTITGGAYQSGTVFRLAIASKKLTVLYTFKGGTDGGRPLAGLISDQSGNLYGTASCGGTVACPGGNGVVFMIDPRSGRETILHTFQGAPDGENPQAALVRDANGNLYGTAIFGGANLCNFGSIGCGTVFELSPPAISGGAWTEKTLHHFTQSDGYSTASGLVLSPRGHLYGVSFLGGTFNHGTLFEVTP